MIIARALMLLKFYGARLVTIILFIFMIISPLSEKAALLDFQIKFLNEVKLLVMRLNENEGTSRQSTPF